MPTRVSSVQGRNRGLGQPPLHERSKLRAERSIIGWGPFFGSGPRFGGEEKKGSKASRTGPGQNRGRGLRHRGFRPMTGCGYCWGGVLVLEFGNWGSEGFAGRTNYGKRGDRG
jgi:hypothetical protein